MTLQRSSTVEFAEVVKDYGAQRVLHGLNLDIGAGEFGATKEHPFRDRFYTLSLQPLSRNPYPRSTTIG